MENKISFSTEHDQGPLSSNDFEKEYKNCTFKHFKLSTKIGNNCCLLKDKSVILIDNFVTRNSNYYIIGKKFENVCGFFHESCHSSRLDIYSVDTLGSISVWSISDISKKFIIFPNDKDFVVFPFLHA